MSDWRPGVDRAVLEARSVLLSDLRAFFSARGVIEVDTPLLCRHGVTDPAIENLCVPRGAAVGDAPRFLQSSPEYAMKRLLAAGSGPIYQLGKAFRDGEVGPRHNPEFTLLEWYRPDWPLSQLIDEVLELVGSVLGLSGGARFSYRDLFIEHLAIDPLAADAAALAACARARGLGDALSLDADAWCDLLLSHVIEPALPQGLVVIEDYPPSQAALAELVTVDGREVAARFELYVNGLELANGYRELRDPEVMRERAAADNRRRLAAGQDAREPDPLLLDAMVAGLPPCSGVALGVDRLLMCRLGVSRLQEVLPFDWQRC